MAKQEIKKIVLNDKRTVYLPFTMVVDSCESRYEILFDIIEKLCELPRNEAFIDELRNKVKKRGSLFD